VPAVVDDGTRAVARRAEPPARRGGGRKSSRIRGGAADTQFHQQAIGRRIKPGRVARFTDDRAAKLGRQPKPGSDLEELKDDQFEFKVRELSFNDRIDQQLPEDLKGVRVITVESAGWAALAGLSSGDILLSVDGRPTESIAALKTILAELRETKPRRVTLFVKRGIWTQFLELEPKW